jgi:hypothetical protein
MPRRVSARLHRSPGGPVRKPCADPANGDYVAAIGAGLPILEFCRRRIAMASGEQRSNKEKKKPKKDAKAKAAPATAMSLMSKGQTEPITKKK